MYMSYTKNPHMPKVRRDAVRLIYKGWSTRRVGRHFGVGLSTISKWIKKDRSYGRTPIPTLSSRPRNHPDALSRRVVNAIVIQRLKRRRCAEVIHKELAQQGIKVSLSSVKRTLQRCHLLRERSPWKRWHISEPRPYAANAGDLVQIDTIHIVTRAGERFYVYTLIDVYSRWAWAKVVSRINTHQSLRFTQEAQRYASFQFRMLQSDHGSEFSTWFTEHLKIRGVDHRHSRVRQSNDNAHVERFNRTIQEECLDKVFASPLEYRKAIQQYLPYYNNERLHLGINLKTPRECVQAID